MKYCLNFENIKNKKLREIKIILNNLDNYIRLSELKVKDLVFLKDKPIKTGNGVYVFRNEKDIVYVGKCSGRSFIERISSHFDIREEAWMNSLLKFKRQKENKKCSLAKIAKSVFNQYFVLMINFENPENNKDYCAKLETCLIGILMPELNSKKEKDNYDEKISLSNQLKFQ